MATKPEECPNYETNRQMCPREDTDEATYAICCECVRASSAAGNTVLCMTCIVRPAETRRLPIGQSADCKNRTRNEETCTCYERSCARFGVCCDCIRFHWGHNVWPKVSCT